MRRRLVTLATRLPLLAGCAGSSGTPGSAPASRALGCSGWSAVIGSTLTAHLTFYGAVRQVQLLAVYDDDSTLGSPRPVSIAPGTRADEVQLRNVDKDVVSAMATVRGARADQSTCSLSSPH